MGASKLAAYEKKLAFLEGKALEHVAKGDALGFDTSKGKREYRICRDFRKRATLLKKVIGRERTRLAKLEKKKCRPKPKKMIRLPLRRPNGS